MSRSTILPDIGQRCVVIDDLRLRFFIGVHEHERKARQEVSITVHMFVAEPFEPKPGARLSDDLADYVSYADIVEQLKARAASTRHVNLVETLAEGGAGLALAGKRGAGGGVDGRKAEIIPEADGGGVIIRRHCGALPGTRRT